MAAKTLAEMVRTETPTGTPEHIGDRDHRRTPDETVSFHVNCEHWPLPKHFARIGDGWTELCGRCGGEGNVGYGPFGGLCYGCNGSGLHGETFTRAALDDKLTRWARRAISESNRAAKKVAAATAEREAWRLSHSGLVAWAQELEPSEVYRDDDSYTRLAATREEAETPEGRDGERFVRSQETEDSQWWALFVIDAEVFEQFGAKAAPMIGRVRAGGMLDKRETAYLNRVMTTAKTEAAERAPQIAASRHAAAVKTRMEITGRVVFVKELDDNGYGSRRMIITEGTGEYEGITWKTFSGADSVWSLLKGDAVRVKATVKEHEVYKGVKGDVVARPVFTVVDEDTDQEAPAVTAETAPAPADEAPAAPAEAPATPVQAPAAPRRATRRPAQGASCVDGWEVLYDKPRARAQVVKNAEGGYGLVCTEHAHLVPLARLTDERGLRKAGGWCPSCAA